jgi:hypothetical protein
VPRRLITDNIISVYECLYFEKRNRSKKISFHALKVDMMEAIMFKLGFAQQWISVIMDMVRLVFFQFFSMKQNLMDSNLQEVVDKVILSHPIFSS